MARERQSLGEGRDVQRRRDPPAHGEHVAARVGGGDGAEVGRVVDERREEVGRGHHGDVVADAVHGGVVERRQPDEQRRGSARQVADQAGERRATPLRRAAPARRPLGQPKLGRGNRIVDGGGLAHGAEPRRTLAPRHRSCAPPVRRRRAPAARRARPCQAGRRAVHPNPSGSAGCRAAPARCPSPERSIRARTVNHPLRRCVPNPRNPREGGTPMSLSLRYAAVTSVAAAVLALPPAAAPAAAAPARAPAPATAATAAAAPRPRAPQRRPRPPVARRRPRPPAAGGPGGQRGCGDHQGLRVRSRRPQGRKGTTVTWKNDDSATHRIKSGDGTFDSKDLKDGDSFEHTFDTAGTFAYICGIHPSMKGTVTVTG